MTTTRALPLRLPLFGLKHATATTVARDALAGVVVGALLIPQGIGYASLATLPAQVGLYSSTVPLLMYALVGSSPVLSVAPTAVTSLLVENALASLPPAAHAAAGAYLALGVGVFQIAFALLNFSFLVSWLSRPMLASYQLGNAFMIAVSQLPKLFGVKIQTSIYPILNLVHFFQALPNTKPLAVAFGFSSLAALYLARVAKTSLENAAKGASASKEKSVAARVAARAPWLPIALDLATSIVFVVATAISYGLYQADPTIKLPIVGPIPSGFPTPEIPPIQTLSTDETTTVWLQSLLISFLAFFESWMVAKNMHASIPPGDLEKKPGHRFHAAKPNGRREFFALGLANLVGSLFQGAPVTGGLSRTAINVGAGATSQLSSVSAFVVVSVALVTLTGPMRWIPDATLAAIVIIAIVGMFRTAFLFETWRVSKREFAVAIITFVVSVGAGPVYSLAAGVGASVVSTLYGLAFPHVAELGEMRGGLLRNIARYPDEAKRVEGVLMVRIDAPMVFVNAEHLTEKLWGMVAEREKAKPAGAEPPNSTEPERISAVLIDASGVGDVDVTALNVLQGFQKRLRRRGTTLALAEVRGPVRDKLARFNVSGGGPNLKWWWPTAKAASSSSENPKRVQVHAPNDDFVTPFFETIPLTSAMGGPETESPPASSPGPAASAPKLERLSAFSVHSAEEALAVLRPSPPSQRPKPESANAREPNLVGGVDVDVDVEAGVRVRVDERGRDAGGVPPPSESESEHPVARV